MFRSIVLFGRNVATYKFALATALMEFAEQGQEVIPIADLARPYALALCTHLKTSPKQVTSSKSRFLSACVRYNEGKIDLDELMSITARLGFQNVIDAFHRVGNSDLPVRFFIDQRKDIHPSILITDNLIALASESAMTTIQETESRWKLVETAWELGMTTAVIGFDAETENLILPVRRKIITSARSALNGYQKGLCFYCFREIVIMVGENDLADVDHVFPHVLERHGLTKNLDGIWNLVLACQSCNRGARGKFDATPHPKYVERLHKRNEYLILSHHPLRGTLINQTGDSTQTRQQFLQEHLLIASSYQPIPWVTQPVGLESF